MDPMKKQAPHQIIPFRKSYNPFSKRKRVYYPVGHKAVRPIVMEFVDFKKVSVPKRKENSLPVSRLKAFLAEDLNLGDIEVKEILLKKGSPPRAGKEYVLRVEPEEGKVGYILLERGNTKGAELCEIIEDALARL